MLRAEWAMEVNGPKKLGPPLRIWVMSDLGTDLEPFALPDPLPDFDALLIPGGIARGLPASLRWLAGALGGRQGARPVLYVPALRDFQADTPIDETLREGRVLAGELGFLLLSDGVARLDDGQGGAVHVVGTSLWTDWSLNGATEAARTRAYARRYWDHGRGIRLGEGFLTPHDVSGLHARGRAFVEDVLASFVVQENGFGHWPGAMLGDVREGDRAVVLTHFAPSRSSLPRELAHRYCDPWRASFFASDLEAVMHSWAAPALWVHGHVPGLVDLRIGKTRVVANPRGAGRYRDSFRPSLIVEV